MPSVLVVDDNAINRELLCEELSHRDFAATEADGGEAALEILETQRFDLVLLDINMPRVDGLAVLRTIRAKHSVSDLPVIMTTANADRRDILEALELGANDYVTKPIDVLVLLARVRVQLALKNAHQELQRLNRQLKQAQEKMLNLAAVSADAVNLETWSRSTAMEMSEVFGASMSVRFYDDAEEPGVPLEGTRRVIVGGGQSPKFGEIVIGKPQLTDEERMFVESFARQIAAALEMRRLRSEIAASRQRVSLRRQELLDQGIGPVNICQRCGACYPYGAEVCAHDGTTLDASYVLAFKLRDRYRLERRMAVGGMARLFAAHDERLDRKVAIKIIKPELFHDDGIRQRFEQEARAIARIDHPGVTKIYDTGELEDGSLYFAMELLHGLDLGQMLRKHGPGTPKQVASLVRQIGDALDAIHGAGYVHRDIKPENIFLVPDGESFRAKIVDFGIAKPIAGDVHLTQVGAFVGTPAYMAPEQVEEAAVDVRTDLYCFAVVAYEALAGRRVTTEREIDAIFREILNDSPPPPSQLLHRGGREIDTLFAQALAKRKQDRPDSVQAWARAAADALERIAGEGGWPADFAPMATTTKAATTTLAV
jgi:eukaryotic-like serine/threonine-protein kinase